MAVKHISEKRDGDLTSVKEICDRYGAPFDVTSRSMQKMVIGGILKSEKGAHGGYSLAIDLRQINFLDFMEMVVEPVTLVSCSNEGTVCALLGKCNIVSPLAKLNDKMRDFFATVTVSDLLGIHTAPNQKVNI